MLIVISKGVDRLRGHDYSIFCRFPTVSCTELEHVRFLSLDSSLLLATVLLTGAHSPVELEPLPSRLSNGGFVEFEMPHASSFETSDPGFGIVAPASRSILVRPACSSYELGIPLRNLGSSQASQSSSSTESM